MRQCVFKRRFGGYKALLCVNIKGGAACTVQGVVVFVYIIVIAIGDDYRFAFFGLVTKLWLKFQGLFY